MNNLLPAFIAVPLGAAFLMLPAARLNRKLPDWLGNLTVLYLLGAAVALYFFRPFNNIILYNLGGWVAPIGVTLVLDGLSHLLLLIINLAAFIITFYSVTYMRQYHGRDKYYSLLMLMIAGMNGVVLTGDLFNLFVFLELAAISSAALVAFGTEAEEMEAAFKYLIMGTIASVMILFGIAIIYAITGTLSMADVSRSFPAAAVGIKSFVAVLFLIGFCTKAAIVPFHAWLPDAHPAAPGPVSAMLSGVLIKALGIYALARIFFNVLGMSQQISGILMVLGAISILAGVLLALWQWDLKRLLAYHSISQIGYIVLGLGLFTPLGIMGALFHLFNHALFKPLLFLNAGAIEYASGTRELKKLGGLAKSMPVTFVTSLFASMSIAGIPPFNGFWSKLFIILACVQAGQIGFALVAVIGSILTLASFLKVMKYAFFDHSRLPEPEKIKEVPWMMGSAMIVFALLCILAGIAFPAVTNYLVNPAVVALMNGAGYGKMVLGGL